MAKAKQAATSTLYRAGPQGRAVRGHVSYKESSMYMVPQSPGRSVALGSTRIVRTGWVFREDVQGLHEEQEVWRQIAQRYMLRDQPCIFRFLQEYIYLVPLLIEAEQQIRAYFPGSPLALEVVTDPEGNASAQIAIFIRTELEPDQAIPHLDRFNEAWWFGAIDRARGKLIISLEYL